MTTTPSLRLLAPVAAVLRNPAAHGCPNLPPNAHYNGHGEVYMDVGLALGEAMVELLKRDETK